MHTRARAGPAQAGSARDPTCMPDLCRGTPGAARIRPARPREPAPGRIVSRAQAALAVRAPFGIVEHGLRVHRQPVAVTAVDTEPGG